MTGADQGPRTSSRRLEPSRDVVAQRLDDIVVLVQLETNRIHELNRTGARFWELLQDERDLGRIERQMLDEFDVPEATLRAEIEKLVGQLESEKLLRVDVRD